MFTNEIHDRDSKKLYRETQFNGEDISCSSVPSIKHNLFESEKEIQKWMVLCAKNDIEHWTA